MVILILVLTAALWLAYSNGANDNFKGVATRYGSDSLTYEGALRWAIGIGLVGMGMVAGRWIQSRRVEQIPWVNASPDSPPARV